MTTIQPCNLYFVHRSHNLPPFVLFHSKTLNIKNQFKLQAYQSPFLKLLLCLILLLITSQESLKTTNAYRAHFASSYFLFLPPFSFMYVCFIFISSLPCHLPTSFSFFCYDSNLNFFFQFISNFKRHKKWSK